MNPAQVRTLLAQGKLKEALACLPETNEMIGLKARFAQNSRSLHLGLISPEEAGLEDHRIMQAILAMLDPSATPPDEASLASFFSKIPPELKLGFGVFSVIATVLGFVVDWRSLVNPQPSEPFYVTIRVRDADKAPIPNLDGVVVLDIRNRTERHKIGENGEVRSVEIPPELFQKPIAIYLEAYGYEACKKEQTYVLDEKVPIDYCAKPLDQFRVFKGMVVDEKNAPLAGVKITVEGLGVAFETDATGSFDYRLPPEKRQDDYRLTLQKTGYKTEGGVAYYPLTQDNKFTLSRIKP